jgi:Flp pilus assembly protein TadD
MQCPNCGLHHPAQYDNCVSCGAQLKQAVVEQPTVSSPQEKTHREPLVTHKQARPRHRAHKAGLPTATGVLVAVAIVLVSAGTTIFLLNRPADDNALYERGRNQLATGQYAFAMKTLEKAAAENPKDARVFLLLARAYVGADQIDKAWQCISQAQQLGSGVIAEPELASDLANYYRQHNQYDRAVDLLRPLAQANVAGKKAELADLDALWGDDALRDDKLEQALKCWEEVKDLREGTRLGEADARLSTIYQKLANQYITQNNDAAALPYLNKLNAIAENGATYQLTSGIYERQGQLEMAVDQMKHAITLSPDNTGLKAKLALLLDKRGKELLDSGDTTSGYGYLQEAKGLDPTMSVPAVTLRNVHINVDGSHKPTIAGEVWNPGPDTMNYLNLKMDVFDPLTDRVLWQTEQKVIDQFDTPLASQATRPFSVVSQTSVNAGDVVRLYLNGNLYNTYPMQTYLGGKEGKATATVGGAQANQTGKLSKQGQAANQMPQPAPSITDTVNNTQAKQAPDTERPEPAKTSPEDKTLKDLDL